MEQINVHTKLYHYIHYIECEEQQQQQQQKRKVKTPLRIISIIISNVSHTIISIDSNDVQIFVHSVCVLFEQMMKVSQLQVISRRINS